MRNLVPIALLILTIAGCGETTQKKSEIDKASIPEAKEVAAFEIDFPLDSLLSFDSEEALKAVFGKHVKRSVGYYPEGMGEYANTLIFPDSKNEVEFVWQDDTVNFKKLVSIKLYGKNTDWKTSEGITIGTKLKALEAHNKKAFTFYGLDWDYGGSIDWNGGHLDDRKIYGSLAYLNNDVPVELDGLIGDHEIESSSALAQKSELILSEIVMRPNE
ncbi:hypothetical protein [Zobellia alginiliquefaciens]|uniref:hypothetical protein n=1 Tax=Zobellia alginiliquefaciens TaxID=3032586 RepID=UPI0023E36606|nr:hypothetical protein [Zobellia alginiliquefaciens]